MIALLTRCKQKESPFFVLDTHAGTGIYDLTGTEAGKTGEYHSGIGRLYEQAVDSAILREYLAQVAALNGDGPLTLYPGSPRLIAGQLRACDRAALCELHPEDVPLLRRALRGMGGVSVHHRDGYEAIGALLPPEQKRGLVLIDPPFEKTTELEDAATALAEAGRRFAQGTLAFWYPVKERPALWRFEEAMIATDIPSQLSVELLTGDEGDARHLSGSGMFLINPPWQLEETLGAALDELARYLGGRWTMRWLSPPQ